MKYVSEFRDKDRFNKLLQQIEQEADPSRDYHFMEFCGGHTHAIFRYGIAQRLPKHVEMVHGPGCPVCVMPSGRIDQAIALAHDPRVILCSYGDMLRVPGSGRNSLLKAKGEGADVRMVYSVMDALAIAEQNPEREVVFFAIGFETTTPPTALAIKTAQQRELKNFSVLCNHLLTPPAIRHILESPEVRELGTVSIDGFLGPSHVSTIIGCQPYQYFVEEYQKPVVVTGFEPVDLLQGILMLIRQHNQGIFEVENQYRRGVTELGNVKAQMLMAECFEMRTRFNWRGLGDIPYSALRIRSEFAEFDAELRFSLEEPVSREHKACQCGAILRGVKKPKDCKIFGKACTPETPVGPCMVSSEGACSAYYHFGPIEVQVVEK
ncbi:hydrogenase formation protein HypD [Dongshaea marina]|uniref:hydrogenase formation protein HypD n=1 Tax=Dongshaea marina TaxID=2047966 RepID=UPI000D3E9C6F|nr:hydrogenase formation protein HypD [Dongshaea marina]